MKEVEREYEASRPDRPKRQEEEPPTAEVDDEQIERDFEEWQKKRAEREQQKREAAVGDVDAEAAQSTGTFVPIEEWAKTDKTNLNYEETVRRDAQRDGNRFAQNEILRKQLGGDK